MATADVRTPHRTVLGVVAGLTVLVIGAAGMAWTDGADEPSPSPAIASSVAADATD